MVLEQEEEAKTSCEEEQVRDYFKDLKVFTLCINRLLQNLDSTEAMALQNSELPQSNVYTNGAFVMNLSPTNANRSSSGKELPEGTMAPQRNTNLGGRAVPITTNGVFSTVTQGTIPMMSNGAIPVTAINGMPIATNGGYPITMNGGIPVISNGAMPVSSNGAIRLGPNDGSVSYMIPSPDGGMYSVIPSQGGPQGNFGYVNGARLVNPEQGQYYQINPRQPTRSSDLVSQPSGSQLSMSQPLGYTQPQYMNGQVVYPQMATVIMPSNNVLVQNGQVLQEPVRNSTIYVNSAPSNSESNPSVQRIPSRPVIYNGMSNPSGSSNSNCPSEESVQQGSIFPQGRNDATTFISKSGVSRPQTQSGSTNDTSNASNHNASVSSHSTNGHQQHTSTNIQQTTGGWAYPVNGNLQNGVIYIPVTQAPTPTLVNGPSQVSCCFSVLYPWQTGPNPNYGPTYQNNSYIYNNSTTFSNYNNAFAPQPNVGFNSNIIISDYPMNNANKPPQMQVAFGNSPMQKAPSTNLTPSNRQ